MAARGRVSGGPGDDRRIARSLNAALSGSTAADTSTTPTVVSDSTQPASPPIADLATGAVAATILLKVNEILATMRDRGDIER